MATQLVRIFFWDMEGEAHSVTLSAEVKRLLDSCARSLKKRSVDVLREVLGLSESSQITGDDVLNFVRMQSLKSN